MALSPISRSLPPLVVVTLMLGTTAISILLSVNDESDPTGSHLSTTTRLNITEKVILYISQSPSSHFTYNDESLPVQTRSVTQNLIETFESVIEI